MDNPSLDTEQARVSPIEGFRMSPSACRGQGPRLHGPIARRSWVMNPQESLPSRTPIDNAQGDLLARRTSADPSRMDRGSLPKMFPRDGRRL
jgi:hypothetical protein